MPKEAPLNSGAPEAPMGSHQRVSGMQAKLHRWAAADQGRRFDDLFNLVCDPATLLVAFERVAGNKGAKTPGVDQGGCKFRRRAAWSGCDRLGCIAEQARAS